MPDIYDVITQVILIVLTIIVLVTIVKAKKPMQYYGAYSATCFVLAGWIGYWIYCINS